jgi:hypothetical protein
MSTVLYNQGGLDSGYVWGLAAWVQFPMGLEISNFSGLALNFFNSTDKT